jgi:hypothetical protein
MYRESFTETFGRFGGEGQREACVVHALTTYSEKTREVDKSGKIIKHGIVEATEDEIMGQIEFLLPPGHTLTSSEIQKYHDALSQLVEHRIVMKVFIGIHDPSMHKVTEIKTAYHVIGHNAWPETQRQKYQQSVFIVDYRGEFGDESAK